MEQMINDIENTIERLNKYDVYGSGNDEESIS